jgi:hypothetical protein
MATEAQSIGAELIDHLADIWAADDEVDEVN